MVSSVLPKKERKIPLYYYGTSSRIVFVRFLGELNTPKRHFENNWPLEAPLVLQEGSKLKTASFMDGSLLWTLRVLSLLASTSVWQSTAFNVKSKGLQKQHSRLHGAVYPAFLHASIQQSNLVLLLDSYRGNLCMDKNSTLNVTT